MGTGLILDASMPSHAFDPHLAPVRGLYYPSTYSPKLGTQGSLSDGAWQAPLPEPLHPAPCPSARQP